MARSPRVTNYMRQLPIQVGLVLMWLFLWGDFSLLTVVGGIVLSYFVTRIFYLPPVGLTGRFHLGYFIIFAVIFIFDVFKASFAVAWAALTQGNSVKSAIIKIPLRTEDDLIMTIAAEVYSLVPGSFVVDIDRNNSIIYLHVIDLKNLEAVEGFRKFALDQEARIIRAIGPVEDMAALLTWEHQHAGKQRNAQKTRNGRNTPKPQGAKGSDSSGKEQA